MMSERLSELQVQRIILCDLLTGRFFRELAAHYLKTALDFDELGVPEYRVNLELTRAAHAEWMALRTEWGHIGWGDRFNRCGWQAYSEES